MEKIPFATHKGANSTRFTEVETTKFSSDGTRKELGTEGYDTQQDCVAPSDTVVQEAQVCFEAGKGEVL
jgi:hypothetical protein